MLREHELKNIDTNKVRCIIHKKCYSPNPELYTINVKKIMVLLTIVKQFVKII